MHHHDAPPRALDGNPHTPAPADPSAIRRHDVPVRFMAFLIMTRRPTSLQSLAVAVRCRRLPRRACSRSRPFALLGFSFPSPDFVFERTVHVHAGGVSNVGRSAWRVHRAVLWPWSPASPRLANFMEHLMNAAAEVFRPAGSRSVLESDEEVSLRLE
ncbi:hypothetical protein EW146_g9066 [Bondarzewia mesenterica]|uniref:Uncharacterized protein n=1 Tax=Bondarzewia mesenterica TaxID=1095465 RepID=A0A4S4L9R7_9AGAM|nr:hypothetical protein EW146_g9066 [Bondarzewia mesenterica]